MSSKTGTKKVRPEIVTSGRTVYLKSAVPPDLLSCSLSCVPVNAQLTSHLLTGFESCSIHVLRSD